MVSSCHVFIGTNPLWNPDEDISAKPVVVNKLNPLYKDDRKEFEDTDSLSSGDSVLIGVEDQPEFKGHKERYEESSEDTTSESSSDDTVIKNHGKMSLVLEPPPFNFDGSGGLKGNPLFSEESEL